MLEATLPLATLAEGVMNKKDAASQIMEFSQLWLSDMTCMHRVMAGLNYFNPDLSPVFYYSKKEEATFVKSFWTAPTAQSLLACGPWEQNTDKVKTNSYILTFSK